MEYLDKLKAITNNLTKCKRVTQYSTIEENEADTLANAFIDIQEAFLKFVNEQIPKLYMDDLTSEEVDDLILDIGEEFRHVLYHINDTKVFDYLKQDIEK